MRTVLEFPSQRRRSADIQPVRPMQNPPVAQPATEPKTLPRGVAYTPYLVNGRRLLIATAANGERVAEVTQAAHRDPRELSDALYQLLDLVDPMPALQVVK